MPLFRRTCKSGVKLKVVLSSWFRLSEILLLFFEETYHMRKWLSLEGPVGQFFREVFEHRLGRKTVISDVRTELSS